MHLAPAYLEHLIYGHTGGFGRSVFQAIDTGESLVGLTPKQPALGGRGRPASARSTGRA